ncbi:MAG: hypothetical protein GY884_32610 [Proteobacteria bacterium]|nr:hypothetical protein [Pseudomonadota bacterium]
MLIALSGLALAADADIGMQLKVTDPMGNALIDEQVTLPYSAEIPITIGKSSYVVAVEAEHIGKTATVSAAVLEGDDRIQIAKPALDLVIDSPNSKARTTVAPRGAKNAAGEKMKILEWKLDASWSWVGEDWIATAASGAPKVGEHALLKPGAAIQGGGQTVVEAGKTTSHWPVEVVAVDGDSVTVRTIAAGSAGCFSAPAGALTHYELDLTVAKADLALVTIAPVTVVYSDEMTTTTLDVGVAAGPIPNRKPVVDSERLVRAYTGSGQVDVALPAGSLGLSYPADAGRRSFGIGETGVKPTSGGSIGTTLGGGVLLVGYESGAGIGQMAPISEAFDVEGDQQTGIVVQTTCSEHRVTVQPARVKPVDDVTIEVGHVEPYKAVDLAEGVAVFWPDESPAGTGPKPADLEFEKKATRACWGVGLGDASATEHGGVSYEDTVQLCFDK